MVDLPTSMTAFEIWNLNSLRLSILQDILEKWEEAEVDVLLCPAFGVPATLTGYPGWLQIASSYTSVFNALDLPAGSMPVNKLCNQLLENLILACKPRGLFAVFDREKRVVIHLALNCRVVLINF